jgi:hypothetical protein
MVARYFRSDPERKMVILLHEPVAWKSGYRRSLEIPMHLPRLRLAAPLPGGA